ncbi:MAG: hypothetical protein RLT05_18210, partial [Bauldia litoralis]
MFKFCSIYQVGPDYLFSRYLFLNIPIGFALTDLRQSSPPNTFAPRDPAIPRRRFRRASGPLCCVAKSAGTPAGPKDPGMKFGVFSNG